MRTPPTTSGGGNRWRVFLADGNLQTVVAVWAVCLAAWMVCLARYGSPLPWCDEYAYCVSGIATHDVPVSWQFLWGASNEHRQPLLRLWGALLGNAFHWDFRPMRYVNTVILGMSGMAMVLAVRKVRGRSQLADVFLPLLVLTPFHYETLLVYGNGNAAELALWCLAASAAMVHWPLQSVARLLIYVGLLLAVVFGGGAFGSVWALGLCGVILAGLFADKGRAWKLCAGAGLVLIGVSAAFILLNIPPPLGGGVYLSKSLPQTLAMAAKSTGTWMGDVPLTAVWPCASLTMIVPAVFVAGSLGAKFLRPGNSRRLALVLDGFGLLSMAASTLAIAVVLGYGRGRYPAPWESRYCVFAAPIAISLYFLLVRCCDSRLLTGGLAIWMAVCVGWNLPGVLSLAQTRKSGHSLLVKELRQGRVSLSLLAEQYPAATGWAAQWGTARLVGWWHDMRAKGISAFAKVHGTDHDPALLCLLLSADSGTLGAGLHSEPAADFREHCVTAETAAARAVYMIDIPRQGSYGLCCCWKVAQPGQTFGVAIDDERPLKQAVQARPDFSACEFERPLSLSAGKHRLAITWPGPGSRMDVLELTPQ